MSDQRKDGKDPSEQHHRQRFVCNFFDEDVVYRVGRNGKLELGIVVESCENASSDEDDATDSMLSASIKKLRPGHAKVAWYPKGAPEIVAENKIKLVDRSLIPGDVVSLSTALEQRGFCKESASTLTIKIIGTNKVIENVSAADFQSLSPISNDVVFLFRDGWVGYIHETKFNVTLSCPDGSKVQLADEELADFEDVLDERSRNSEFEEDIPFIGQHFLANRKAMKHAHWIKQSSSMKHWMESNSLKRNNKVLLAVDEVVPATVDVKWLCCISSNAMSTDKLAWDEKQAIKGGTAVGTGKLDELLATYTATVKPPGDCIVNEDISCISELNYYKSCSLQVGDRGYYVIKESDALIPYEDWKLGKQQYFTNKQHNVPTMHTEKRAASDEAVATKDATADDSSDFIDLTDDEGSSDDEDNTSPSKCPCDQYPDGRKSRRLGVSVRKVRNKRLKPSKRREMLYSGPTNLSPGARLAVEIIATSTRARVQWQDGSDEKNIPSQKLHPMHHLDNHDFFTGDFVVENKEQVNIQDYGVVQKVNSAARTALLKWFRAPIDDNAPTFQLEEEVSVYDIKDHPDFHYRPGCCVIRIPHLEVGAEDNPAARAGQILDLRPSGQLLCSWADKTQSLVYPQELYIIGEYDSDDLWGDSDYDNEDDYQSMDSWETASETPLRSDFSTPGRNRSRSQSIEVASGETVETLRKVLAQLEEWFGHHQTLNYKNSVPVMQKMLNLCKQLKSIDASYGTKFMKLKDLQLLVENTKPPPGSSGKLHTVAKRLSRILSSDGPSAEGHQEEEMPLEESEASEKEFDDEVMEDGVQCGTAGTSLGTPNTQANLKVCLELVNKLKTQLLAACSKKDAPSGPDASGLEISSPQQPLEVQSMNVEDAVFTNESGAEAAGDVFMAEDMVVPESERGTFNYAESVPDSHKFKLSLLQPQNPRMFLKKIREEVALLKTSLPADIMVKTFEDRMDLLSFMIKGPKNTPYEDGLFVFDLQLPATYPLVPPVVHYISFCNDRLNPNLYESGKVCVSLLGTWSGKGSEVWSVGSNLLQVLVSIQGLILVDEPYYNEAGYLKQKTTAAGNENSRLYNEMAVVKLVQSMAKMVQYPPEVFKEDILAHMKVVGPKFIMRLEKWIELSTNRGAQEQGQAPSAGSLEQQMCCDSLLSFELPSFPLLPGSQGFCLSLKKALKNLQGVLRESFKNI